MSEFYVEQRMYKHHPKDGPEQQVTSKYGVKTNKTV